MRKVVSMQIFAVRRYDGAYPPHGIAPPAEEPYTGLILIPNQSRIDDALGVLHPYAQLRERRRLMTLPGSLSIWDIQA